MKVRAAKQDSQNMTYDFDIDMKLDKIKGKDTHWF